MTTNPSDTPPLTVAETIEMGFADGMGTIKDLGIQFSCENGRLKHMMLPYRDDLVIDHGTGMPANLAATLLDTAFGLDVMLYANVMKYTATIDFTTAIISNPNAKCGLLATTEVVGTNAASVIIRGEVREIETGRLILTGQGNFLNNRQDSEGSKS